ncbi:MAG: prepilin-type N-terminal cleavage/methylation domain-containing protein [Candidatus Staskawiczbacteria bacterium]|nr:prepilin-type N-terminal cleavage/methylation domain-containing protein [Candidatus Staskawiczbacteria bacterium]
MKDSRFLIKNSRVDRGFTIIELMVAIVVLSFGIMGAYGAFLPFINATYSISHKFTGVYLAQEGLEITRNLRDTNFIKSTKDKNVKWSDGLLDCQLGCQLDYKTGTQAETLSNRLRVYNPSEFLKINEHGLYGYDNGTNTKFKRKVTVDNQFGADILKVSVVVAWDYNNKPYSFETIGYLYNWY